MEPKMADAKPATADVDEAAARYQYFVTNGKEAHDTLDTIRLKRGEPVVQPQPV
jgi:hypothetical protein